METVAHIENGVIFGKEGYLFLADGGHHVLDLVTGRRQVSSHSFANFDANIQGRSEQAALSGAKFLHVVFPDKQSVMRTQFPIPDPVCLGELYATNCPDAAKHVLNLTQLLRQKPNAAFQKTDTHLTDQGVALTAAHVAEILTSQPQATALDQLLSMPTTTRLFTGDLGRRMSPPLSAPETFITPQWQMHHFHNDIVGGNDGMVDIYISPGAPFSTRLLWFGDSFGRSCSRMLSFFFREIVFLRTRFFHHEMVQQIRPDIVVTQNVERYMDCVLRDDEAPPFLMYPHLKQLPYAPTRRFAEAFSAVLSYPRAPYKSFISKLGLVSLAGC